MKKQFWIITLVLVLLIIGAASGMAYFEVNSGRNEALVFSAKHNRQACVQDVMTGDHTCLGVTCSFNSDAFFEACMERAPDTDVFCKDVPVMKTLFQLESWKKKQCELVGRSDRNCKQVWAAVNNICKQEKSASYAD